MRWGSLPGFGDRIPLSSGTIEPVERFLTTVPDNRWLGQPFPPEPMGPVHGLRVSAITFSLPHSTWFFLPDSRGSTHGLTDR